MTAEELMAELQALGNTIEYDYTPLDIGGTHKEGYGDTRTTWNFIKEYIRFENRKVIDIGACCGFVTNKLIGEGAEVWAVEIIPEKCGVIDKVIRFNNPDPKLRVINDDWLNVDPPDCDIILALNVLHKFEPEQRKQAIEKIFSKDITHAVFEADPGDAELVKQLVPSSMGYWDIDSPARPSRKIVIVKLVGRNAQLLKRCDMWEVWRGRRNDGSDGIIKCCIGKLCDNDCDYPGWIYLVRAKTAYDISEYFGMGLVPEIILGYFDSRPALFRKYIHGRELDSTFPLVQLQKLALFDLITNTYDRWNNNLIMGADGMIKAIDNGDILQRYPAFSPIGRFLYRQWVPETIELAKRIVYNRDNYLDFLAHTDCLSKYTDPDITKQILGAVDSQIGVIKASLNELRT